MNRRCEIEGCLGGSVGTANGIHVCERCRIHGTSIDGWSVYFGGRWHGVRGWGGVHTWETLSSAGSTPLPPRRRD